MASYADGVTIKVNDVAATITAAEQQADHAVIRYTLATPVEAGDTVTWEYSAAAGHIVAETGGAALESVSDAEVTNNVEAPDPVRDALRLACVANWKFDESSDTTRKDASGNGWDAVQYLTIPAVAGKLGNAAEFHDSTDDTGDLEVNNFTMSLTNGFTVCGWIKTPGLTCNEAISNTILIIDARAPASGYTIQLYIENVDGVNTQLFDGNGGGNGSAPIPSNEWAWFRFWRADKAPTTPAYYQINHGEITSDSDNKTYVDANGRLTINGIFYMTDTDYYYLDELSIFNRVLTDEEDAYLYNSGAGRALFPAP